jgi:integrase
MEHSLKTDNPNGTQRTAATFEAVYDSRNRRVRGLWKRGDRFYAQLRVPMPDGRTAPRRLPLEASDLNGAQIELGRKRTDRADNKLRSPARRPTFAIFAADYLKSGEFRAKKLRTQQSEQYLIERWIKRLGGIRIDKISLQVVNHHRSERVREGVSARTANLEVIALRQVLNLARVRGHIEHTLQFFSPRHGGALKALPQRPAPKRRLLSPEQVQALLSHANEAVTQNAEEVRFFLRFLTLTGAREQEALAVARRDVDFTNRLLTIGADGESKNSRSRTVNFSPELESLLQELEAWLPPDTSWLFPSPQRGRRDTHAKKLRDSFNLVRAKAELPRVGFHDLRHYFCSVCVMAGIDFMTIAAWLGHQDGGILVGKVYGHLAAGHKQEAARKLKFFNL